MKLAVKGNYGYYHLLSGVDLPLKTQDEIHLFFEKNKGIEFVQFYSDQITNTDYERLDKYHFFIHPKSRIKKYMRKTILGIQNILGVHRCDSSKIYQKGAQWFSITHDLATYVVDKYPEYGNGLDYTYCSDEVILQTIVANSPFYKKISKENFDDNYKCILRAIDWQRGTPYVWRKEDYLDLIHQNDYLFARKFSEKIDFEIVKMIEKHILNSVKG